MSHPRPIPSTHKKKKPAPDSEAAIQKRIIALLERRGFIVIRTNSGQIQIDDPQTGTRFVQLGSKGRSDLHACQPVTGRFIAIEVKRPGNKPTPKQQAYIDRVNAAGGLAFVATSVDDVKRELQL